MIMMAPADTIMAVSCRRRGSFCLPSCPPGLFPVSTYRLRQLRQLRHGVAGRTGWRLEVPWHWQGRAERSRASTRQRGARSAARCVAEPSRAEPCCRVLCRPAPATDCCCALPATRRLTSDNRLWAGFSFSRRVASLWRKRFRTRIMRTFPGR